MTRQRFGAPTAPTPNGPLQHDTMIGGAGNDWIYTSHGTNTVSAGPGNDIVWIRRLATNQHYTLRDCEHQAKL